MQATRPPHQAGTPDKQREPSPQRRLEQPSPGHTDQGKDRQPGAPRRPSDGKANEGRKPTDRR